MIGLLGPVTTVLADAVSYLLSALGIRAVGGTKPRPAWPAPSSTPRRPATDNTCARLSPIAYEHIDFLDRYAFARADPKADLRPFRDGEITLGSWCEGGGV
ncbi:hypothetical protein [Actinomadura macrotermitis]|uniref:hypothetical protein n=1 Tax=Actinomadura macrotermitis TaxID=2585200 RepID=UPI001A9B5469|nr:hypothetical protein [Actinomadura macrotermitis]